MANLDQASLVNHFGRLSAADCDAPGRVSETLDRFANDGGLLRAYLAPQGLKETDDIYGIREACASRDQDVHGFATLAAHWLHKCLSSHNECSSPPFLSNDMSVWPRRLVDLEDYHPGASSGSSTLKVVRTEGRREPYCALSYRWPTNAADYVCLTFNNVDALSKSIDPDRLSGSIRDVCTLAKQIGIRFVWVDALCIVHGSKGDWHEEARNMASIFMNALFTLSAVDGTRLDAAAQFRPFLSNVDKLKLSRVEWQDLEKVYWLLSSTDNFISREHGELDTRGWALQEKMLSRRVISLTHKDIFWDCLHHSASGRRPCGILGDFSPRFRDSDDRVLKRLLLTSKSLVKPADLVACYWHWRKIVQDYTRRKLTYETDRLIALDGIISRLSAILGDTCPMGIWRGTAHRSLIWFVDPNDRQLYSSKSTMHIPSWSWVAVNSPIQYRLWHPHARYLEYMRERIVPVADLEELWAQSRDKSVFFKFRSQLKLRGPVFHGIAMDDMVFVVNKARLRDKVADLSMHVPANRLMEDLQRHMDDRQFHHLMFLPDWPYDDRENESPSLPHYARQFFLKRGAIMSVTCILLCEGGYNNTLTAQYCLVLVSGGSILRPEPYSRVGLCVADSAQLCLRSRSTCPRREAEQDHLCLAKDETINIV